MPNRNYPRYTGGSGLADLLSGLADGYKMGSALKSQRDADKLARDREARYVAEEAAKRKQQELDNQFRDMESASRGLHRSTEGLDLGEQVTTRDNSDARSVLGATRALGALPGMDVSALAPLLKNTTEDRYQVAGGGALDRVRTDPLLQTTLKNEATRQTGLQQNVEQDRSARALDAIAPNAGAVLRAGGNVGDGLRYAESQAQRADNAKLATATRAGLEEAASRLKIDPTGLDDESLKDTIRVARQTQADMSRTRFATNEGIRGATAKAQIDAANAPPYDTKEAARLRTQYRIQTKTYADQAAAIGRVRSAITDRPQGADDVALIFNYMKLLDPTSVVRESEYATAQNTGLSVGENVRRLYNKALTGQPLTEKQRRDIVNSAERQAAGAQQQLTGLSNYYGELAAQSGIPAEAVTYDYFKSPVGADPVKAAATKLAARVKELTAQGMNTEQALAKARAEQEPQNDD